MMLKKSFKALAAVAVLGVTSLTGSASAQLLDAAVWFEREVGDGVVWRYYQFDNLFGGKQSVSYMEVDLAKPGVDIKINYRNSANTSSPPAIFPRALTSVLATEIPGAKAAVNGTYFNTASYNSSNPTAVWGGGTTYLKVDNSIVHTFDGTNVNNHGMGILFDDVSNLTIARKPTSGGWAGIQSNWTNMMVCGPVLLESGTIETYAPTNNHANLRHPRTAIGKTADNKLILFTVDGRTAESLGMSCTELATTMKALGCVDAINLDGGGSTTLWAAIEPNSGVVNYPSDNGVYDHAGQRGAANAFVVVANNAAAKQWDGRFGTLAYDTLTRSGNNVTVTVTYTNIGTETWTTSNIRVVPSRSFGRTSAFVPTGSETTFFTMSPSSVAPGQTATFTLNLVAPTVASDTNYSESFALWHTTEGYFGPPDNKVRLNLNVRPPLSGAPPIMIVQGGSGGPNNQWYSEPVGSWSNSTVGFTAPGVANPGTQRFVGAGTTNRQAMFSPVLDAPGVYKVEAAFPASDNSITAVRYEIAHLNGTSVVTLNQQTSGGNTNKWNLLGQYEFSDASTTKSTGVHSVTVTNGSVTGNRFYSGAVRFDYVEPLNSVDDWSVFH